MSHNRVVMTSIAQLIKTSEFVFIGRDPVQASAVFLNELIISLHFITLDPDPRIQMTPAPTGTGCISLDLSEPS